MRVNKDVVIGRVWVKERVILFLYINRRGVRSEVRVNIVIFLFCFERGCFMLFFM